MYRRNKLTMSQKSVIKRSLRYTLIAAKFVSNHFLQPNLKQGKLGNHQPKLAASLISPCKKPTTEIDADTITAGPKHLLQLKCPNIN